MAIELSREVDIVSDSFECHSLGGTVLPKESHDESNEADCICFFLVALFDVHSFDAGSHSHPQNQPATDSQSQTRVVYVCA
jgi:hypothetical protein